MKTKDKEREAGAADPPKIAKGLGALLTEQEQKRYEEEVLSLDALDPQEARRKALSLVRRLAYTGFNYTYPSESLSERFGHLWGIAFPDEKGQQE